MANLKQLKQRIAVVNSTKKITSAMKMVAAAKLRRSQDALNATRPYSEGMKYLVGKLIKNVIAHGPTGQEMPLLIKGNGDDKKHLLLIVSSDKGLCGGFNSAIARLAKKTITDLKKQGKDVQIMFVGKKARDALISEFKDLEFKQTSKNDDNQPQKLNFFDETVGAMIEHLFEDNAFNCCSVIYNEFVSTVTQKPTVKQVLPLNIKDFEQEFKNEENQKADYDYEPSEKEILEKVLPDYVQNLISRSILESFVAENAARMTSMDAATRNAKEMINKLALIYNRTRQSMITTELIEIISGAEAL
ncbi:MAG: ATP synthase gamma chain [Alphaproteobacteria bacterium ADurb.Bin438]|nr:MAG: ATP synthase gamma chain [Alphaproteobacteria bacterium ADurb.Bin438]